MVALGTPARKLTGFESPQHARQGDASSVVGRRVSYRRQGGWSWVRGDWWYGAGWLWCVMIVGGVEAVLGGGVVGLMSVMSLTPSPIF